MPASGQIEHDANIATLALATRARHARCQCFACREPDAQHERARAVINGRGVEGVIECQHEEDLDEFVSPRRKLVFHHFSRVGHFPRHELAFFQLVQFTREQDVPGDSTPVE